MLVYDYVQSDIRINVYNFNSKFSIYDYEYECDNTKSVSSRLNDGLSIPAWALPGLKDKVDGDASLALLRQRMELLRAAMNSSGGDDGDVASDVLLKACLKDPFLRELQATCYLIPKEYKPLGRFVM